MADTAESVAENLDIEIVKPTVSPPGAFTINVSKKALKQIAVVREEEGSGGLGLRVSVVGGGCSGLSYKLGFEKDPSEKDKVFEFGDVRLWIDPKSALYINGLTLDFSDGLNGKGFVFINPNAKRSCGCGSSFSA